MNRRRLSGTSVLNIFVFVAVCGIAMNISHCSANPYNFPVTIDYLDNGTHYSYDVILSNMGFFAGEETYCAWNCKTAANREYDHGHAGVEIPCWDITRSPKPVYVDADKVNAYWDTVYDGWTPSGNPTSAYNCHGHAMGQTSPCIVSTANGSIRFRTDAGYTSISEPTTYCICSTMSHSYKITAIYSCPNPDRVATRTEKSGGSRIYTITYDYPGVQTTSNLYEIP